MSQESRDWALGHAERTDGRASSASPPVLGPRGWLMLAPCFTPQIKSCPSHEEMVRAPAPGSSGGQSDQLAEMPRISLWECDLSTGGTRRMRAQAPSTGWVMMTVLKALVTHLPFRALVLWENGEGGIARGDLPERKPNSSVLKRSVGRRRACRLQSPEWGLHRQDSGQRWLRDPG